MTDSSRTVHNVSEKESMRVAEAARQKEWKEPSFLREMFLGNFRLGLIRPLPDSVKERPEFTEFYRKFRAFLEEHVDPVRMDETGEYPPEMIAGLKALGAFGMKIPTEYGGLGFNQVEYGCMMELVGSYDGNVCALLSAHQSIGVPQPIKLFGTKEQKERFLPRCAAGAISAFALTEEGVGSDPARLATTVEPTPDGQGWIIDGDKLWCTNGTCADLFVVMAKHKDSNKISAFVVEGNAPGVKVLHRCRFMGLRAIENGVIRFDNVRIPKDNLIGREGQGLKIALVTLNTGRLSIPAAATGVSKLALEIARLWAAEREQWGAVVGKHEAIAHKLADLAATTYAMESVSDVASRMADRGGYDIRLEAAAAKEFTTDRGWRIADDLMQIRGGRGYETEGSLAARGERPFPCERIMRDFRINRIFEGSSEIMHLFMAREAVDRHLQVAGDLIDPEKSGGEKFRALMRAAAFYGAWYPTRWLGWGFWPRYSGFGTLGTHLRFAERRTRKLARTVFHGMVVHGPRLQKKQAFLFRAVDIATELFAISASCSRARAMREEGHPQAPRAERLADLYCRGARRRVRRLFRDLWRNDDVSKYRVGQEVLAGDHAWVEENSMGATPRTPSGTKETQTVVH